MSHQEEPGMFSLSPTSTESMTQESAVISRMMLTGAIFLSLTSSVSPNQTGTKPRRTNSLLPRSQTHSATWVLITSSGLNTNSSMSQNSCWSSSLERVICYVSLLIAKMRLESWLDKAESPINLYFRGD